MRIQEEPDYPTQELPARIAGLSQSLQHTKQSLHLMHGTIAALQTELAAKTAELLTLQHSHSILQGQHGQLQVNCEAEKRELMGKLVEMGRQNARVCRERDQAIERVEAVERRVRAGDEERRMVEKEVWECREIHRREVRKLKEKFKQIQEQSFISNKENYIRPCQTVDRQSLLQQSSIEMRGRPAAPRTNRKTPGKLHKKSDSLRF